MFMISLNVMLSWVEHEKMFYNLRPGSAQLQHGLQRRMISVDNFFVFLRLLFFAVLLLYVT